MNTNAVAQYAAKNQNMPRVFAHENPKTGMPTGAAIVNGIVATAVLLIQLIPNEAISDGLFWTLFATSVVFLLLTYIPMFPAFLKLRKVDANRPRVYRFPFSGTAAKVILAIPVIELVLACVVTVIPLSAEEVADKVPMLGHLRRVPYHGRRGAYCECSRSQRRVQGSHARDGRRAPGC